MLNDFGDSLSCSGYNSVAVIPRGATNIDVRQYAPYDDKNDDMYLGKKCLHSGDLLRREKN